MPAVRTKISEQTYYAKGLARTAHDTGRSQNVEPMAELPGVDKQRLRPFVSYSPCESREL